MRRLSGETALAALTAVSVLILIAFGIGRPFWLDDAGAVWIARKSLGGIVDALRNDNNFPAFHFVLHFWIRLFGESEVASRSLTITFYLGGGWCTYALSRAFYGNRRAAAFAALFYLASAQVAHQAQSVRSYSMLGFLAAGSLLLFFRLFIEEKYTRWRWIGWFALNSIGLLTHVWFFFVLLGQFAYIAIWKRSEFFRFVASAAACGALFAVVWGPFFLQQLRNGSTKWFKPFSLSFVADVFGQFYGSPMRGLPVAGLLFLGAAALPLFRASGVREFLRHEGTRLACVAVAAGTLIPVAISVVKPIYYPGRYSTIALPALAVLLGSFMARFSPRRYALAICSALLIATTLKHVSRGNLPEYAFVPGQSDQAAAEYIHQHAEPGDAIVFASLTRTTADYYFRKYGSADRFIETSYPRQIDEHPGWIVSEALLENPTKLQAEAEMLAAQLAGLSAEGKRVWLYYGMPEVTDYLKRRLDRNPGLVERHEIEGVFHSELLVYGGAAPVSQLK